MIILRKKALNLALRKKEEEESDSEGKYTLNKLAVHLDILCGVDDRNMIFPQVSTVLQELAAISASGRDPPEKRSVCRPPDG